MHKSICCLIAVTLSLAGSLIFETAAHAQDVKFDSDTISGLGARNIGSAVVADAQGRVLGILSERDIVHAIGKGGAARLNDAVSKHMTSEVLTTYEDETVDRTMEKMTHRRCRHLPVVENGKLAGIVSIGDVVKYRLEQLENEHQAMREYIASA